jgi:hypothetical protein
MALLTQEEVVYLKSMYDFIYDYDENHPDVVPKSKMLRPFIEQVTTAIASDITQFSKESATLVFEALIKYFDEKDIGIEDDYHLQWEEVIAVIKA